MCSFSCAPKCKLQPVNCLTLIGTEGLREVSKVRYEQTFVAENPSLKDFTDALKRQKSEQTPSTLASVWNTTPVEASETAERLVKAGFFERREVNERLSYWVPFIYRDALELVQGMATE